MADTTFVNGVTLTDADWFNDVNRLHYTIFGDPSNAVTALANLSAVAPGQGILLNGQIVTSVGSNALTISIKGADGNDPSSTNPVSVAFRSATLTTSGYTIRKITAALSLVVSSGSTLGHASALACHLFVYLIDNSGTVELAVSNLPPDYPGVFGKARLVSTTAEGGAGAADSATGVYSTTARSNVPWICVAKILTTQTTAGTWAAAITQIDQAPFVIPSNFFIAEMAGAQSLSHTTWTKMSFSDQISDPDNVYDAATNYRWQPNVAGPVKIRHVNYAAGSDTTILLMVVYKNGSRIGGMPGQMFSASTDFGQGGAIEELANGTTDYFEAYGYQSIGSPANVGSATESRFSGHRISGSNS